MSGSRNASPQRKAGNAENIKVSVRCRPLNEAEIKNGASVSLSLNEAQKVVRVMSTASGLTPNASPSSSFRIPKPARAFQFDEVFGPNCKQRDVFDSVVAPAVLETIAGYNCTVFAYGPTGTGKTHTMVCGGAATDPHTAHQDKYSNSSGFENDVLLDFGNEEEWGMIPRAAKQLFHYLNLQTDCEYSIMASYLEICKEWNLTLLIIWQ